MGFEDGVYCRHPVSRPLTGVQGAQVNIKNLIDDAQCYQTVRELRWPEGVKCPSCESSYVIKRGWLRPHRGISQEKLPLYLGFFEFVHNVRRRGKALLGSLIELLVS